MEVSIRLGKWKNRIAMASYSAIAVPFNMGNSGVIRHEASGAILGSFSPVQR